MRVLNTKRLVYLLATLAAVGGAATLLLVFQSNRVAQALLRQARRAEDEGRLEDAAKYLRRYLAFAPEDIPAMGDLGLTLDKIGQSPSGRPNHSWQAFLTLEQVVRREPDWKDIRRQLVRVAMRVGRYPDAVEHLEKLLAVSNEDGEL